MTYNASESWQIDHQCPQCGAPVTLDEADRLLLCPFCRTKLYLVVSDHFRYCIPAPEATSRDIIYLPYWRLKGLSFAVSNQEVTSRFFDTNPLPLKTEDWKGLLISGHPQDRQLRFIPTLCPQCGWDLHGDREALILICRNCDSAWSFQATGLERVTFSIITADREDVYCYLPFWRMKASIEGISLSSYADLIRVGNLPKAITRELEEKLLYFWSPAFKINPALFLRWTRQMTIYQPEGKSVDKFPEATIHPVTLPVSEAQESIAITLASLITDKRKLFPLLPKVRIAMDEFMLEYHPFLINRNELS